MRMRPAIERLRELFDLFPDGTIRHRPRAVTEFPSLRVWRMWRTRYEGKLAGSLRSDGYVMVTFIDEGERYDILAHIVIWALYYGRWPAGELDHRDGVGVHNWIDNLREANRSEQLQNTTRRGTSVDPRSGRYQARITRDRKVVNLGTFDSEAEAHQAYLKAKSELHVFQPVPRDAN